jgi:hypothetical protein
MAMWSPRPVELCWTWRRGGHAQVGRHSTTGVFPLRQRLISVFAGFGGGLEFCVLEQIVDSICFAFDIKVFMPYFFGKSRNQC